MLEKTIAIGDKQVKFRSSATIPRLYRVKFKRDIFKDLSRLESSYKVAQEQAKQQLENGELGQDKYDALQREIVETEEELRRLPSFGIENPAMKKRIRNGTPLTPE